MIQPRLPNVDLAFRNHLIAFGFTTSYMLSRFYTGPSQSTLQRGYRHFTKLPIKGWERYSNLIVWNEFRGRKKITIDEALRGLGDAWLLHQWSGHGQPLIGVVFEKWLMASGLGKEWWPQEAGLGFYGTGVVLTKTGEVCIPMYLGGGHASQSQFTTEIGERWIRTWAPMLTIPGVQSVHILGYGMGTLRHLDEKFRKAIGVFINSSIDGIANAYHSRDLRSLNWSFNLCAIQAPPLSSLLGEVLAYKPKRASIQLVKSPDGILLPTPKKYRRWLTDPGDLLIEK